MKRTVAILVVPLLLFVAAACNGDGDDNGTETPTPTPPVTATPTAPASPTPTGTPEPTPTAPTDQAICLQADEYLGDGAYAFDLPTSDETYELSELRWAAHEGCERFVIELSLADGSPAASAPGIISAEWDRDLGILHIHLERIDSVDLDHTDLVADGPLLDRAYVVREGAHTDGTVLVELHLREAAEASVILIDDPARVVVDLRPGGSDIPPLAATEQGVVIRTPREGTASYPLTVTGYARTFEANVVVRIEQDGETVFEENTTANDWTEMWGWFELTIPSGPSGDIELHVGDHSARDGEWEGAMVELDME